MLPQKRHNFIDWMKAVGMFLIVFGHVVGQPLAPFAPIYIKQVGVAFFVFVLGWSLANEKRSRTRVIFNRLLPMYFWGICTTITISIIMLIVKHNFRTSDYTPFILGINVFFNYFPANPTTWYIGTYLHLLLFWALFCSRRSINPWVLPFVFIIEIIIRSAILQSDNTFISYMLLTNWLSIFLLGMMMRNRSDRLMDKLFPYYVLGFTVILFVWGSFSEQIQFDSIRPFFMKLYGHEGYSANFIVSICISMIYILYTIFSFEIFRRLPSNNIVKFFAEHSIVIFIVHYPIIKFLAPIIYSIIPNIYIKKTVMVIIAYLGLAIISRIFQKIINVKTMRQILWEKIEVYLKCAEFNKS